MKRRLPDPAARKPAKETLLEPIGTHIVKEASPRRSDGLRLRPEGLADDRVTVPRRSPLAKGPLRADSPGAED